MGDVQHEDPEKVIAYAAQDPDASLRLHTVLLSRLREDPQRLALYHDIELPIVEVIVEMENNGMGFDPTYLDPARDRLETHLASVVSRIGGFLDLPPGCFHCGHEEVDHKKTVCPACPKEGKARKHKYQEGLNVNSPQQVVRALYESFHPFGLVPGWKNATPTDKVALAEHITNPLVKDILEARAVSKMLGTYVNGLPKWVEADGRIHCEISQTGTLNGRPATRNPNLANIPARNRDDVDLPVAGKEIRKAFRAEPGNVIMAPDLSQIEMRILAHLSEDPDLIHEVTNGDVHDRTTHETTGMIKADTDKLVWDNARYVAKTTGFGVVYGLTAVGLFNRNPTLEFGLATAEKFIDGFYNTFSKVRPYQDSVLDFVREHGYYETAMGRLRYFPDIWSDDQKARKHAENAAVNFPIQGYAADIFKMILIKVYEFLKAGGWQTKLINQVYDEIVMEGPKSEVTMVRQQIVPLMENTVELLVPTPVELEVGPSWGELELVA
jgi:DNA polymerase-1